jgi:hypothetical protein
MSSRRLIFILIPLIIIIVLLILIVVASQGGSKSKEENRTPQAIRPTTGSAATGQAVAAGSEVSGPRVLAWHHGSTSSGRLMIFQSGALPQEQFAFPAGDSNDLIQRCSHQYRSPDADGVVVFVGGERGSLVYEPLDGHDPITIGQTGRLTCAGPDTFQFIPGSNLVAYIRFGNLTDSTYRSGVLTLYDLEKQAVQVELDHTAAFEVSGGELLVLRFYPNGEGNADEADVDLWSSGGIQNLTTLVPLLPSDSPDAKCFFVSGAVTRTQDTAAVLIGQHCDPGGSGWQLASVPLVGGNSTAVASGEAGGGYFVDNFTTQLFPAADGSAWLITIPSGLERHIVQLVWVDRQGKTTPAAEFALADRLGDPALEGQHLLLSPDQQWLAVEEVTRNGEPSLWLFDLSRPGTGGQQLITLGKNESVFDFRWGPGNRLFYVAGTDESSSLWVATPEAEPQRLVRGQFASVEPDSSGQYVGVAAWVPSPTNATKRAGQVVLIDLGGSITPLWQGDTGEAVQPLGVQ